MCVCVCYMCVLLISPFGNTGACIYVIYNMISQVSIFTKRDARESLGFGPLGAPQQHPLEDRFPFGARLIFRGELLKSPSGTCMSLALFLSMKVNSHT